MNFGEKLKKIRTERNLTQPQLAELVGIEQSYLSKLENDKSIPSADMFSTILTRLEMDDATFLDGVDKRVLAKTLSHIPAVAQYNHQAASAQVQHTKHWLYGSAAAWILGFAMMLAAHDGIFFSNKQYLYTSPGLIRPGEPENIFDNHRQILQLRMQAGIIKFEEMSAELEKFQVTRVMPVTVEWPVSHGTMYFEPAEDGRRRFDLVQTKELQAPANRILKFLGAIVFACGFVGLFIEWRLRRMKAKPV